MMEVGAFCFGAWRNMLSRVEDGVKATISKKIKLWNFKLTEK